MYPKALFLSGRAGGAGRDQVAFLFLQDPHQHLARYGREGHVQDVGRKALSIESVGCPTGGDEHGPAEAPQLLHQLAHQGLGVSVVALQPRGCPFGAQGQSVSARQVLGSRSAPALLPSSDVQETAAVGALEVQRSDPPGAGDLVGAQGQAVHAQLLRSYRDLAEALHGVAVEVDLPSGLAAAAEGLCDLPHGLDGPRLVVDQHQGHQTGVLVDARQHALRVHPAVRLGRDYDHLVTVPP